MRISNWSSDLCSSDLLPIVDVRNPVVADLMIVETRQEGVGAARRLQVDVAELLRIGAAEIIDVDQIAIGVLAHRACRQPGVEQIILAIFIDEVAIMIDEGEVLAREVAIGAEKARLEMLAAGDPEFQRIGLRDRKSTRLNSSH